MKAQSPTIISEINITPLTDIFLVLLIIMMVVAPMLEYPGLKLSVPTMGPDAETTEEPKVLTIQLDADDTVRFEGEVVPRVRIAQFIRRRQANFPEGVVIEPHPQSSHTMLTTVMDAAQLAGVKQLAVVAQPDDMTGMQPE